MPLLYLKFIGALLIAAALFGAYKWVGSSAVAEYKAEQAVLQAKADKIQQDKYNELSADYEILKAKRQTNARVVTKQVEKIVTRDVYRNVCIDDDGLRVINEAISGGHSSEPNTTMSPNTTY